MKIAPGLRFFAVLALAAFPCTVWAGEETLPPQNTLLEIPPGLSVVDLTGDKKPEMILKAWRGNGNAHNAHIITFMEALSDSQTTFWAGNENENQGYSRFDFDTYLLEEQKWSESEDEPNYSPGQFSIIGIDDDPNNAASNSVWTSQQPIEKLDQKNVDRLIASRDYRDIYITKCMIVFASGMKNNTEQSPQQMQPDGIFLHPGLCQNQNRLKNRWAWI